MNNDTKSLGVGRSEEETNMSLDTTSHPDRPGPDELIRSGYALRVGEIDARGQRRDDVDPSRDVGRQRRPGRPRGLAGRHVPAAEVRLAAKRGRGRRGGRNVLIDAGRGAECRTSQGGAVDPATGRRRPRSRSLTDVVLTDMHMDHLAGCSGSRVGCGRTCGSTCGRRGRVLGGGGRSVPRHQTPGAPESRSVGRQAIPGRVPWPVTAL